jgi:hypothetical protein
VKKKKLAVKRPKLGAHSCNECNAARIDELRGIIKQLEVEKAGWLKEMARLKSVAEESFADASSLRKSQVATMHFRNELRNFLNGSGPYYLFGR